jgi:hypothetical protein
MKNYKKFLRRFSLVILGLILTGLLFPTWTPEIKGKKYADPNTYKRYMGPQTIL